KALLISAISTAVIVGAILYLVLLAPGSKAFRDAFLNGKAIRQSFPSIVKGFRYNIEAMIIAEVLILVFALVLAVLRQLKGPVFFPIRLLAIAYIALFRSVPILIVLYLLDFGLPALNLPVVSYPPWSKNHVGWSPLVYGVVSLVLVYSAYVAEV